MVRKTIFSLVGIEVKTGGRFFWPVTSKPLRALISGFFAGGGGAVSGTFSSFQRLAAATRAACAARSLDA